MVDWLCVDDVFGVFVAYALSNNCNSTHWNYMHLFISPSISTLFQIMSPSSPYSFLPTFKAATIKVGFRGMDDMYIPYHCDTVADWNSTMIDIINKLIESSTIFQLATLWVPSTYMSLPIPARYRKFILHLVTR